MTTPTETLIDQSLGLRQAIVKLLQTIPTEQAEVMPPTWTNNARWHTGHLIVTPYLLTYGVLGQPLGKMEDFKRWFAKGTSPAGWGSDSIPGYHDLVDDIVPSLGKLLEAMRGHFDETYLQPYTTSVGIVIHTPAQALNFSMAHDGMHFGMLRALRRSLGVVPPEPVA